MKYFRREGPNYNNLPGVLAEMCKLDEDNQLAWLIQYCKRPSGCDTVALHEHSRSSEEEDFGWDAFVMGLNEWEPSSKEKWDKAVQVLDQKKQSAAA